LSVLNVAMSGRIDVPNVKLKFVVDAMKLTG